MNVNMNAMSFYGKQGSELPGIKKGKPGQLLCSSSHQTNLLIRRKATVATESISSEPSVERTQCGEEQPPWENPYREPRSHDMPCPRGTWHAQHRPSSGHKSEACPMAQVLRSAAPTICGLVSHRDSCPRAESL